MPTRLRWTLDLGDGDRGGPKARKKTQTRHVGGGSRAAMRHRVNAGARAILREIEGNQRKHVQKAETVEETKGYIPKKEAPHIPVAASPVAPKSAPVAWTNPGAVHSAPANPGPWTSGDFNPVPYKPSASNPSPYGYNPGQYYYPGAYYPSQYYSYPGAYYPSACSSGAYNTVTFTPRGPVNLAPVNQGSTHSGSCNPSAEVSPTAEDHDEKADKRTQFLTFLKHLPEITRSWKIENEVSRSPPGITQRVKDAILVFDTFQTSLDENNHPIWIVGATMYRRNNLKRHKPLEQKCQVRMHFSVEGQIVYRWTDWNVREDARPGIFNWLVRQYLQGFTTPSPSMATVKRGSTSAEAPWTADKVCVFERKEELHAEDTKFPLNVHKAYSHYIFA